MFPDLYNRMILRMTGQLPTDPLAARRLYGGSGDIGQESRVTPATKNGLPGIVDVDLRTGKGVSSSFRRPDMETSNVPTYDSGASQYIYDGAMRSTPLTSGLDKNGKVDRTQSDEYKATRARYDQLRKAGPEMVMTPEGLREKAVDYGLQEWAKMYPQLAAKQEAAKYGTFNPLMQQTFGYQTGEAPDQVQRQMMIGGQRYDVDPEAIQYQNDQQRAAEMGSPNLLAQQEMQQQATAAQANQGMEEKESVLKKTNAFLNPYYNRMF